MELMALLDYILLAISLIRCYFNNKASQNARLIGGGHMAYRVLFALMFQDSGTRLGCICNMKLSNLRTDMNLLCYKKWAEN